MSYANRNYSSAGFNQNKSNNQLDNNDDLTKQIVSFKGGEIALREVYGNAKLLEEEGKNRLHRNGSLIDDIVRNENLRKNEMWSLFALRRMKYTNSYLEKISNLLCQSKHYKNYSEQRKNVSSGKTDHKSSINLYATPSKPPFTFYSSRTRNMYSLNSSYGKTINGFMNKTPKSKTLKIEPKLVNNNDKDMESKEEDRLRFDEGFVGFRKKIFNKLENENNFYKEKEANVNEFDLIKEKIFRVKNPMDKRTYLRNEYFNLRNAFTKKKHLIRIRDKSCNSIQSRNASYDLIKKFQTKDGLFNKYNSHQQSIINNKKKTDIQLRFIFPYIIK